MAHESPERLFRDEHGAAIERIARLEDENRQLRAEVDRLTNGDPSETPASPSLGCGRPPMAASLAAVVIALTTTAIMTMSVSARRSCHPRRATVHRVAPRVAAGSPVLLGPQARDCTVPYVVDARGTKHYRPECLGAERATAPTVLDPTGADECSTPWVYDAATGEARYKDQCLGRDEAPR